MPLCYTVEELLPLFEPNTPNEGPHFTDDPEMVYLWSTKAFSDAEMQKIARHLRQCAYCQAEIAEMVQSGVLSPVCEEARESQPSIVQKPARQRFSLQIFMTSCAVGILALVLGWNQLRPPHSTEQVAFQPGISSERMADVPDRVWLIYDPGNDLQWKNVQAEPVATPRLDSIEADIETIHSSYQSVSESERNTASALNLNQAIGENE